MFQELAQLLSSDDWLPLYWSTIRAKKNLDLEEVAVEIVIVYETLRALIHVLETKVCLPSYMFDLFCRSIKKYSWVVTLMFVKVMGDSSVSFQKMA